MNLSEYFEKNKGKGVLSAANSEGKVSIAIYARPHFMDGEEVVAFIMNDRLTHKYLQSNNHAAYLFIEDGDKYAGKRLYLTKIKEEENQELVEKLSRRKYTDKDKVKFLVYFKIDNVLPLVGDKE